MSGLDATMKVVWGVVTRGAHTMWTKVGIAWDGPNGSVFLRLDALPISGELCVREWEAPVESGRESVDVVGPSRSPYVPRAGEPIS